MSRKAKGRRKGSRNKGYFYRTSHKVWVAQQGKRFIPLVDENGDRLRDANTPEAIVKAAYARFLLSQKPITGIGMTLWELSQHYIAHIERTKGAVATLESRADTLFDFCTGYGRKWRKSKAKPSMKDRLHEGFGKMPATELRPFHIHK